VESPDHQAGIAARRIPAQGLTYSKFHSGSEDYWGLLLKSAAVSMESEREIKARRVAEPRIQYGVVVTSMGLQGTWRNEKLCRLAL
jgi:hypothetical protein